MRPNEPASDWSHIEALLRGRGAAEIATYPRIAQGLPVLFRDRFSGREHTIAEPDLSAFVEITAANELDVLDHNQELAERHGAELRRLLSRAGDLLSPAARAACTERLSHA